MNYPVAADLTLTAALAATALPLAAFAVILLLTRGFPRVSAALSISAITVALVAAGALTRVAALAAAPNGPVCS